MATFNFNIVKNNNKKKSKHEPLIDYIGVVFINKDGIYSIFCKSDYKYYPISSNSDSTVKVREVYRLKDGEIIKHIRDIDSTMYDYSPNWLPYAPGKIVKGNIINGTFHINKVYEDMHDGDANKALHQYKNYYKKEDEEE